MPDDRFRRIFEHAPIGIAAVGPDFKFRDVNEEFCALLGYRADELIGRGFADVTHPDDVAFGIQGLSGLFGGTRGRHQVEKRYLHRDGTTVWVRLTATLLREGEGGPLGIAMVEDIGEERRLSERLAKTEEHLRVIVSSAPLILFSLDPQGRYLLLEGRGLERLGIRPGELIGTSALDRSRDRNPVIRRNLERALAGERFVTLVEDRGVFWETSYFPVRGDDGGLARIIGLSIDVTEREAAARQVAEQQELLIRNSKLAALGNMAGGISHEINNPLTVIYGHACAIGRMLKRGELRVDRIESAAAEIAETCRRIESIIDGLRAFSRDGDGDPLEAASVCGIMEDTLRFCQKRIVTHGIRLNVDDIPARLRVLCRPVQVSEILLNLLNNAHDAVEGAPDPWIAVSVREVQGRVEISVSDSGPGIGGEVRERIFQPFFTTKPVGQGTGLGLSISKGLAESNRGKLRLDLDSAHTRFVLLLTPASEARA